MTATTATLPRRPSALRRFFRTFLLLRESKVGMVGAGLVIFWILLAILAPVVAPFSPTENYVRQMTPGSTYYAAAGSLVNGMPVEEACTPVTEGEQAGTFDCGTFWFGTDLRGRDTLSRIIYGAQQVLLFAPLATLCAYLVGIPMGWILAFPLGMHEVGLWLGLTVGLATAATLLMLRFWRRSVRAV